MTQPDSTVEQTMTRYLLGAASESECGEVEDRFLRDAEYLIHLQTIEDDLIDDYVRGEMPEPDRRQFENRLQSSPQRKAQVARARRLMHQLDAIAAEAAPETAVTARNPSLWQTFVSWLTIPRMALQYGFGAAALLLLLGGLWLLRDARNGRENLDRLTAERDSIRQNELGLQRQLSVQQFQQKREAEQLQKDLDRQRINNESLRAELKQISSRPAFDHDLIALALTPGIERGSDAPLKLVIPKGIRKVKLQLELTGSSNYRSYRAELTTPGGSQVWSQSALSASSTDYGRFVILTIPSRALEASEYELTLRGVTGVRKSEVAGYYYFIASPGSVRQR